RPLDARHRPRGDRHPGRRRAPVARRGEEDPPRPGPPRPRGADLGLEGRIRGPHPQPAQADGLLLRLGSHPPHARRGLLPGRPPLVHRTWAWKYEHEALIVIPLKQMGCSFDSDRTRFTLDEVCPRAVRRTFFNLCRDDKIFRGKRLVNWDTQLRTAVADDEI